MNRRQVEDVYRQVQEDFCSAVETVDGLSRFGADRWARDEGGGGLTRILAGEGPIEKAAVNFSAVEGETPGGLSDRLAADSDRFYATGVSIIVHPRNPHAATFHANLRYFETDETAWFGGGADLTPFYLYEEDAEHFHATLAAVCAAHPVADYDRWKRACDQYFHLPHRGESRGVGGLFFDHLTDHLDEVFVFQNELGKALADAYVPILKRRVDMPYGEREIEWHEIRRGRYAEFNLVWDRGTRFGLDTSGRVESVLSSLPPRARWMYGHEPAEGTPEARLLEMVRGEPRSWV
ncbi:MAG TPA: oxygen-dependent coproporphyrinogen oxidase [Acidimicrobiia bacterium]|jgi:coproporphyrinogen III oxidase|nr:oxygen-dependent coproporphyrinogen oxidase [Acidimicrobiia bacterium]